MSDRTRSAARHRAPEAVPTGPAGVVRALARRVARRRAAAGLLVASLVAAPLAALVGVAPAEAAITTPFARQFSANTHGDVIIRGNTSMTCVEGSANCATARAATAGTGANFNNNGLSSQFVDVDGDATTFNSSSATVTLPAGAGVLYAALVWGADTGTAGATSPPPNAALRNQVKLKVPGAAAYTTVVSPVVDVIATGNAKAPYQGYVDVTSLVQGAGSGTYTVADLQATRGTDLYAGWALVVAVSDPSAPSRNLTVYRGFGSIASGEAYDIGISGFLTPPSGPVRTTLGQVSFEGDLGSTGDQLLLNGTQLSNGRNPATNVFNSTITDHGVDTTGRTPTYNNQLGFDADLLGADGILANSATSATIRVTSTSETYYPGVITFATELYEPNLTGSKTVSPTGPVVAGQELTYTVPVMNEGLDASVNSRLVDSVPTGTTYVPGSLAIDGVPVTDATGDDTGFFTPGVNGGWITAHLGAGATATTGGTLDENGTTDQSTVTFRVTVNPGVVAGQEIDNVADFLYRGRTTGAAASTVTNAVSSTVAGTPPGGAPTTTDDVVSFTPRSATPSTTIPVLANDSAGSTVTAHTDPAGGTVVVNPDGTVTYTPRADFAGRDVFTYTVTNAGGGSSTAVVYVDVVNDQPTAVNDAFTVSAGAPALLPVLANDTDPNGDPLGIRTLPGLSTQGGTLAVVGGQVQYTPPAGFRGTDTFTYTMEDSRGAAKTATVTVTVANNPPVAGDDTLTVQTGAGPTVVPVVGNDTDADGDTLTVTAVTQPATGGTVTLTGGVVSFTPTPGYAGPATFTYTVSDGHGGTDTATVTVTVNGAPAGGSTDFDTATGTPVTVDVVGPATDPNGDPVTVTAVTQGAHGSVVVGPGGTVTYTPAPGYAGPDTFTYTLSDGNGGLTEVTVDLTVANADPVADPDQAGTGPGEAVTVDVLANDDDGNIPGTDQELAVTGATVTSGAGTVLVNGDGTLTVTPTAGFKGDIVVTYTINDGAGGTATGTLTVTVDDALPTAVDDSEIETPTGEVVTIDVLANDVDPNDDVLTITAVTPPVDSLGVTRGTVAVVGGELVFTPAPGFAGVVTFEYTITDGASTSTAQVEVEVLNADPVAVADTTSTPTDTAVVYDVLANDTDPNIPGTAQELVVLDAEASDGATVTLTDDGELEVTPAPGFTGTVTVTYTVSDGAGGTATGTLTVTVDDAAPVAVDDAATTPYATPVVVDVLANDTDANGDPITIVAGSLTTPSGADGTPRGTVTVVDGKLSYTPPAGFSGVVTFDYTVTAGGLESTATVTVTVADAPPVAAPDAVTTTPGQPVRIDVLGNDSDADGGTLRVTAVSATRAGGTVVIDGGTLVYTPPPGFTGTDTFTYEVTDGQGGVTTSTVTVTVAAAPGSGPVTGPIVVPVPGTGSGTAGNGAASGSLPRTGTDVAQLLAAAFAAAGAGTGLLLATRRRQRPSRG